MSARTSFSFNYDAKYFAFHVVFVSPETTTAHFIEIGTYGWLTKVFWPILNEYTYSQY